MIPVLKSEFRKLLTVRATYGTIIASLLLVMLFAGFGDGYLGSSALNTPGVLAGESAQALFIIGLVLAIAGLLLVGNEYRYNTIMYTLTSSNRRIKDLVAKVVAVSVFAVLTSLFMTFFAPLCTVLGAHLHGHHIAPQTFDYWGVIWRCVFCGWGYAMYALILATILRSQIGALVTFLLFPLIGENILGILLKHNMKYLPFNAVGDVVMPTRLGNDTTSIHSLLIVLVYVAVGWLISAILFVRRDAN